MRLPPFVRFIVYKGTLVRVGYPDSSWDIVFGVRRNLRRIARCVLYAFAPWNNLYCNKRVFLVPWDARASGVGSYVRTDDAGTERRLYLEQPIDKKVFTDTIGNTMSIIQPLSDRVFLEPLEEDRMTKSGIVLPDSAEKERPIRGRVLAIGAGKRNDRGDIMHMSVKVGDIVLFKKYGPDEIELEGKKYLVAEEGDILAIINN